MFRKHEKMWFIHVFFQVFDELLLDADWSTNAGSWMWLSCSSFFQQFFHTYCPVNFGKRTDPNGDYIRFAFDLLHVFVHFPHNNSFPIDSCVLKFFVWNLHLIEGNHWRAGASWAGKFFRESFPKIQSQCVQFHVSQEEQKATSFSCCCRKYLPVLKGYSAKYIYEPWTAPEQVQRAARCIIGKDYPVPMVDHNEASRINMERMVQVYQSLSVNTGERILTIESERYCFESFIRLLPRWSKETRVLVSVEVAQPSTLQNFLSGGLSLTMMTTDFPLSAAQSKNSLLIHCVSFQRIQVQNWENELFRLWIWKQVSHFSLISCMRSILISMSQD